jgi:hypothetical protein
MYTKISGATTNALAERMRVSNLGVVTVGTTSNAGQLNVQGAGASGICMFPSANGNENSIGFRSQINGSSSQAGDIWAMGHSCGGVGSRNFGLTANSIAIPPFTVLASGFVGISKIVPTVALDVHGVMNIDNNIVQSSTGSITTGSGGLNCAGTIASYNGRTTAGNGVIACASTGVAPGVTGAPWALAGFTTPASGGPFALIVSGYIEVLTYTSGLLSLQLTYTSPGGTVYTNQAMTGMIIGVSTNTSSIAQVGQLAIFSTTIYAKANTVISVQLGGSGVNTSNSTASIYYA